MRRRDIIAYFVGAAAALQNAASAQQRPALQVVGFLGITSAEASRATLAAFFEGLKETRFVVDRNFSIEFRWAQGHLQRLPAYASELVAHGVAVIVAPSIAAALAAKSSTQSIPIVFVAGRSVDVGLTTSFSRPSGNATGVDIFVPDLIPKRLELLRELLPNAKSVAYFVNPDGTSTGNQREIVEVAARATGFHVELVEARTGSDIDKAFVRFSTWRPDTILAGIDPLFYVERHRFIALVARHEIPAIYEWPEQTAAGGLMSLGPSLIEVNRMVGIYTGKILAGVRPVDLPVQQPTRVELVINLKTAKALGLTVPTTLLLRADEVIE